MRGLSRTRSAIAAIFAAVVFTLVGASAASAVVPGGLFATGCLSSAAAQPCTTVTSRRRHADRHRGLARRRERVRDDVVVGAGDVPSQMCVRASSRSSSAIAVPTAVARARRCRCATRATERSRRRLRSRPTARTSTSRARATARSSVQPGRRRFARSEAGQLRVRRDARCRAECRVPTRASDAQRRRTLRSTASISTSRPRGSIAA